jgi:tetratricopeptide (TPR) repeat protein
LEKQSVLTREVIVEKVPKQVTKQEEHPKPEVENLGRAEQLFKRGDYDSSLKENQRVLSISGKNPPGDKALFNMGLIYAHGENPKKDYEKSLLFFKKVLTDYPQSPWAEEAKIWVGVLQENEKLKKVIEKFKEVDIEVEKKKREKAR